MTDSFRDTRANSSKVEQQTGAKPSWPHPLPGGGIDTTLALLPITVELGTSRNWPKSYNFCYQRIPDVHNTQQAAM